MITYETAEPVTPTSEPENQWDRKRLIKFDGSMFNRRSIMYWKLLSQILNTYSTNTFILTQEQTEKKKYIN